MCDEGQKVSLDYIQRISKIHQEILSEATRIMDSNAFI